MASSRNRRNDRIKIRAKVSSKSKAPPRDGRWWVKHLTEAERGASTWATVKVLETNNGARDMRDALFVALYENELPYWLWSPTASGVTPSTAALLSSNNDNARGGLNLIKSATDTAASLLAKNIAEVRVLTSGGTWKQQKRSKQLTKALSGAFDAMDYHHHRQRAFTDGCLTRRGFVKFWPNKTEAKIECERVPPHTLIWNEMEGQSPQNLYQKQPMPRESLIASYPEHEEFLAECPAAVNPVNPAYRRASSLTEHADMVDVVEAWHLPPTKDAEGNYIGGRHVIMVEGQVLLDEEWEFPWFPFATFVWDDSYQSYSGKPLAEIVYPFQRRVGRMMRTIQRAQDQVCVPRVFVEDGSEVVADHITNESGGVVRYKGTPPVIAAPAAMAPEYYEHMWRLKDEAFAEAGLNALQARGEKPAGLDSEPSLREYNDITNTRQVTKGQRLEAMDKQAATIIIALMRQLYKDNPKLVVLAPGTKFLEQISWGDVDMEEDQYILRSFAVSALPTHAVGRIQTVTELIKAGIIPQDEAAGLLGFPDLEKVTTLANANKELAMLQVDSALYEGEYIAPEPYQDTELLVGLATKELLFSVQLKDVPAKNREFLLRLISEGEALTKRKAAPATPAATPVPGAAPLGAPQPGALPAAQMAPNVPEALAPSPAVPTVAPAGLLG